MTFMDFNRRVIRIFHRCPFNNKSAFNLITAKRFCLTAPARELIVREVIKDITVNLRKENVSEARLSAEYIVSHVLGNKHISIGNKNQKLNSQQLNYANKLTENRKKHMPLQYVLEEWDFRDMTLKMAPPVFIPRPETEELIDHIINYPATRTFRRFVEIGPGSGAICISLLRHYEQLYCIAFEANKKAADLTLENAEKLNVADRLTVHHTQLTDDTDEVLRFIPGSIDFIVSNPPYITTDDMKNLQPEIKRFEDPIALHGGTDGLNVIRCIMKLAHNLLQTGSPLWLEVDSSHPPLISAISESYTFNYIETFKDFNGKQRFCLLKKT